ncbi:Stf0 family sulfotransferase [Truepera radiovictrix]|uniref:Stf0 sulfotransferase n=1 Tax=Truepera radiovictrix (strain DSM 17093 / CIP 108686 / LMG 22925 / RQ-24) TaxID=649638 RepID=D7CR34_TRURR|nr:Stf0 family sulfotransferase [Truepera radiovictrix]ADI13434.1 Stf0 sulfotransferase [Truepera radiovictrix DSM 17093]WMT58005.1 Stf0 family sulfotransferase [Truepera radiovictrix]
MTPPNPTYWLCTTPRSGSSALGDALSATGVAGRPTEYFNRRFWPELFARFGLAGRAEEAEAVPDYLRALVFQTASPNGVFGVKAMLDADMAPFFAGLRTLRGCAAHSEAELIRTVFPGVRFVYLTRRNKVRQAVSFWRAQQSGVWERYHGDAVREGARAHFDFAALSGLVQELSLREARWQELFDALEATPYTVVYEDYVRDPEGTVRGILDFLELAPPPGWSLPRLTMERLADETSDAWVARYLAEAEGA